MKNKNILRVVAAALIISLFSMCTKNMNGIEDTLNAPPGAANTKRLVTQDGAGNVYTVQPSEWMVDGTNVPPGAIVYIPAGKRGALLLKNFKGTEAAPIVVINKGGKVTFSTTITASYGFKTINCRYFKILGNGDPDVTYGFDVNGGNIGITMDGLSSDFEIANVEVHNSGFAGIMAKTDPTCDASTWRGNFIMQNVFIHDNYVHKTGGEGLYIGNSFYANGVSLSCGKILPHDVVNVKIYHNLTDSTGNEGIQVGSAVSGCEIYNNIVRTPGINPFAAYQDNGIQMGEGTGGKCYNNLVSNAPGNGIIVLGLGDNQVFNNIVLDSKGYGIFADSRYTPGPGFQFINNTIIGSALGGIKLNSETILMNTVINNVIIQAATVQPLIRKSSNVKLTALNNYIGSDINACGFVDYSANDFHLLPSSPLVNAGADVVYYDVKFDYYGTLRSADNAFDIGATAY